ncbi:MAG: amidohydrolase family protein [Halobacteriales archaeon]
MTDLLVENARVVDGTGAPWFRGAVAVEDGRIAAVRRGEGEGADAARTIDADGSIVCPGFVDPHSHSDLMALEDPLLAPKLRQGITTEVLGQDGFSMAPLRGDTDEWAEHVSGLAGDADVDWEWSSLGEYLDALEAGGLGPNLATHIGHGTVRYAVMGMADRAPEDDELDRMADLVTAGLEDGALGFSTGLVYAPQVNADTDEVRALAERLAPYGRPFVAHIRSEGRWLWSALDEFVDVGATAGVPLHLSHYKVAGAEQHGKAGRANGLLEAARERGIDITAEAYPYTAGNTVLATVLPPWVQADSPAAARERLADPEARERIRRDIEGWRIEGWENPALRTGWGNIEVRGLEANPAYEGRSVAEIAADRDQDPVGAACDLLLAEGLDLSIIAHAMAEPDVREILDNERVCLCTDGLFGAAPHPRTYGAYPRLLGHYVREENLLTLEAAVRKATSLPARAMGLDGKGLLRPGMDADLVVFDPVAVGSPATFAEPTREPRGIEAVVVSGEVVVRGGDLTGARPGRALRA